MPELSVVKVGGALLDDAAALYRLWEGLRMLRGAGSVVLVHGGGPQATAMARRLGHEPRLVHGRRVTTDLDLDILLGTVCGQLNTRLVAQAQRQGLLSAVGLTGADGALLSVRRRPPWTVDGETVDFGWVGDVTSVDLTLLLHLLDGGFVPIVGPVGLDAEGQLYNVNADTVSRTLAVALRADRYLLVTDAGGLRFDAEDPGSRLDTCTRAVYKRGVAEGWIAGGMRVKAQVALDALDAGVGDVRIIGPAELDDPTGGTRFVQGAGGAA
ncbi:MAG: acetylglutamate kinase [Bacteroidota bacterium]